MSKSLTPALALLLWLASACMPGGYAIAGGDEDQPVELPIIQEWQGDYPVSLLNRLPQGQRGLRAGYVGDDRQFQSIWRAFKPQEDMPTVDFDRHLVVFYRNVDFYNHITIFKVLLKKGIVEILAMQTRSALPIEDKVAMALAVIPRAGVTAVEVDGESIPLRVPHGEPASDPMNATYILEGEQVRLKQGRAETVIEPESASRVRTSVFGEPADGDLDGDGEDDVALILVNDAGGSGSFYYVAVAQNLQGKYRGGNAVWLGDRIDLRDIAIRNGLVIVRYLERSANESMTTAPTVARTMVLHLDNGRLMVRARLGEAEQLLQGWVRIGHEVRSFAPCGQDVEYWLVGNSPALPQITAGYHETVTNADPYAPTFMILAGHIAETPSEGFGAEYSGAIVATHLIGIQPEERCPDRPTVVEPVTQ
ncbi:MAG: hypothetical protein OES46_21420 [Gammaproteobacteria bacterium]|nr:hypothetical protein [Gammaproteobacteria bacterium]